MIHPRALLPFLLAFFSTTANAQSMIEETRLEVSAKASIDKQRVALSGVLLLTLRVEGPAALNVEAPPLLLTPASLQLWKLQVIESPTLTDLGAGRQRWQQDYRVFPYVPGKTIAISLAPMKVRFGAAQEVQISWMNSLVVEVTKSIDQADPSLLHPITGVEEPPGNTDEGARRRWMFMAIVVAVSIVTMLIVALLIWRKSAPPAPVVSDAPWAIQELEKIALPSAWDAQHFDRLASVLRRYFQYQLSVPSVRLSTPELMKAITDLGSLSPETVRQCQSVLERCDVAKFATSTDRTDSTDVSEWIDRARQLITQIELHQRAASAKPIAS